jgi:hypothetical protein
MIKINLNGVDQKVEEFSHPISGGYASGSYRFKHKSGPCYNPDGSINHESSNTSTFHYGPAWDYKLTGRYHDDPSKAVLVAQESEDGIYRVNDLRDAEDIPLPGFEEEILKRMGESMKEDIDKAIRNLFRSGFTGR